MLTIRVTQHTELDRRLDIEDVDAFRDQMFEQPYRLLFGHRHDDLLRLVRQIEEVRRVNPSMGAEAFAGRNHSRAADAEVARGKHQPLGQWHVPVAAILLGEERNLVSVHRSPSLRPRSSFSTIDSTGCPFGVELVIISGSTVEGDEEDETAAAGVLVARSVGRRSLVSVAAVPALIAIVKEDCPTCGVVMPLLEAFHRSYGEAIDVLVVGQTLDGNATLIDRHGLTCPVLDDSRLKVSFAYDIDMVPSVFVADAQWPRTAADRRVSIGTEWHALDAELAAMADATRRARIDWAALPAWRPGCGSLSVDPRFADRLRAEAENSPLRARKIEIAPADDEFEFMFDQGFTDGLPVVPPTPERVIRMLSGTRRDPQSARGGGAAEHGRSDGREDRDQRGDGRVQARVSAGRHRGARSGVHR